MARLARIQSRTAVGLVLAGGGARGFAHLGIYRALQEEGVEIDCVGGTSIGSVMAAYVASDQPLATVMANAREAFRTNPTGDFNLLPLMSLIKGRRLRHILHEAVGSLVGFPAQVEDLWKNYYCVATNYSRASEHVIRHGNLTKALLASVAIPGALPPVLRDGEEVGELRSGTGDRALAMLRLDAARTLLAEGLSLKAIAARVGLRSSARLGQAFERRFGMAPSLFREMHAAA